MTGFLISDSQLQSNRVSHTRAVSAIVPEKKTLSHYRKAQLSATDISYREENSRDSTSCSSHETYLRKRLYFMIAYIAAMPSFQLVFLPWAYVRP